MNKPGNDPEEPRDEQEENREDKGFSDYPTYPSTPHPEDNPSYGQPPAGYPGYEQYNIGNDTGAGNAGSQPIGTGKVNVTEAVGWAFGTTFRHWRIWILGAVLFMVVLFALSFGITFLTGGVAGAPNAGIGADIAQLVVALISLVLMIYIYHAALRQIDKSTIGIDDITKNVNLWPSLGTSLVVQAVTTLIVVLVTLPITLPILNVDMTTLSNDAVAMSFLGRALGVVALVGILSMLLSPLTSFIVWYVVDRRAGFREAISLGIRNGLANYGKLLLFFLISGLVLIISAMITLGLAMIILGPVLILTTAMLFRQMSSGPLPVPTR